MPPRAPRRWFWLLVLLVGCVLAGIESRPPRLDQATPVADVASAVGRPFQSILIGLGENLKHGWRRIAQSGRLERDNARLSAQLADGRALRERLDEERQESARLRALVGLRERLPGRSVAARAVGRGPSPWFETLGLNIGRREGVGPGCAVLAPGGLVGQVYQANHRTSRVLCLTDREGRVGVRLQPERARGVVGVLQGSGGPLCTLAFPSSEADVRLGDPVVTSGQETGSLFPPGLLVGHVVGLERRPDESLLMLSVRPAVDLGQVEETLVLLAPENAP